MKIEIKENKYFLLLALLALIGVAMIYQMSYAKYARQTNGSANMNMASWNVKVNGEAINGKTELTNSIVAEFPGNDYIKAGVIAPGATGYFDIIIDSSDVDVSFTYQLWLTPSTLVPDITILGYRPDYTGTTPEGLTSYNASRGVSGTIGFSENTKTIRVFVIWDDSPTNQIDNSGDTSIAIDNTEVTFDIRLRFSQLA